MPKSTNLTICCTEEVIGGQMTKGEKVYVIENYLVEARTASLLAGEVGLDVIFEWQAGPGRVRVTDHNSMFWEIPTTAVCKVPEGHLSDLYQEPCLACGLRLSLRPEASRRDAIAGDVIRRRSTTGGLYDEQANSAPGKTAIDES